MAHAGPGSFFFHIAAQSVSRLLNGLKECSKCSDRKLANELRDFARDHFEPSLLVRRPNVTAIDAHRERTIGRVGRDRRSRSRSTILRARVVLPENESPHNGYNVFILRAYFRRKTRSSTTAHAGYKQKPWHAPRVNLSRKSRFKSKIVLNQFSCVVSGMRETKMFVCLCS